MFHLTDELKKLHYHGGKGLWNGETNSYPMEMGAKQDELYDIKL